jgi:hypothetical protein
MDISSAPTVIDRAPTYNVKRRHAGLATIVEKEREWRAQTFRLCRLALIRISSPVAGLRPLRAGRAGRIRTCRMPRLD